jgi:hypothetical protein
MAFKQRVNSLVCRVFKQRGTPATRRTSHRLNKFRFEIDGRGVGRVAPRSFRAAYHYSPDRDTTNKNFLKFFDRTICHA